MWFRSHVHPVSYHNKVITSLIGKEWGFVRKMALTCEKKKSKWPLISNVNTVSARPLCNNGIRRKDVWKEKERTATNCNKLIVCSLCSTGTTSDIMGALSSFRILEAHAW